MNLTQFIHERTHETYAEPRCEMHDAITAAMAEMVVKHIPIDGKILDIGCGQGPALEWFTAHGFKPIGTTTNLKDWKACTEKGYDVRMLDMHEMPDNAHFTAAFDLVWARHVLEHSIAPLFALHECARMLKQGGILYAEMPAPDTVCGHDCNNPNHYSVLGARMWASLIRRSGFEIVEFRQLPLKLEAGDDCYLSFICKKNPTTQTP